MGNTDEHDNRPDDDPERQGQSYKSPVFISIEAISVTGLLILGYMFATDPAHRNTAIWIFFGAYLLVGFFAALYLTKSRPNELDKSKEVPLTSPSPVKDERPNVNITSHGQSGGFTGINEGTLNLAPPPRVITPEQRNKMISALKSSPIKPKEVVIMCPMGDRDAEKLMNQFDAVLSEAEIPHRPSWWGGSSMRKGVWLLSASEATDEQAAVIGLALKAAKIPFASARGPFLSGQDIELLVGPSPQLTP